MTPQPVKQPELLEYITRMIVEYFRPKRIVLFGSRARGDAGPDSDYDLMVEMESDLSPPKRAIEIDRIFGLRNWAMDLIVYTPAEVERSRDVFG